MRLKNSIFVKNGFTIVEVLVSTFIFALIFTILITLVSMASGKTVSKSRNVTMDMRTVMDSISQKMNNANAHVTIGGNEIYGFRVVGNTLVVASSNLGGTPSCFYFEKRAITPPSTPPKNRLEMAENSCSALPVATDFHPMHPDYINITDFSFDHKAMTSANPGFSPYIKIKISAIDTKENIGLDFQSSYILDYLTVRKLSQ